MRSRTLRLLKRELLLQFQRRRKSSKTQHRLKPRLKRSELKSKNQGKLSAMAGFWLTSLLLTHKLNFLKLLLVDMFQALKKTLLTEKGSLKMPSFLFSLQKKSSLLKH